MGKYRHLVVGAGRVGAAYNWPDDAYSHAGASLALSDRVELVGFVEPDTERAGAAYKKWGVHAYFNLSRALKELKPDIVSVCVQPNDQKDILMQLPIPLVRGVWCEKPYVSGELHGLKIQVNYLRRACFVHLYFGTRAHKTDLVVYGKDDIHTRCHFEDLAKWWKVSLDYRVYDGPCAYACDGEFFDNGGIDAADCMRRMLGNLLDVLDGVPNVELFSPPY